MEGFRALAYNRPEEILFQLSAKPLREVPLMPQKVFSFRLSAAALMVIGLLPSLVFTQDGKSSGVELIVRGVPA